MAKINSDSIENLNLTYQISTSESDEFGLITSVDDELYYKRIYDHDDSFLGIMPLIRVNFELRNRGNLKNKELVFSLHRLKFWIDIMQRLYDRNKKYVEESKDKFGNDLITREID